MKLGFPAFVLVLAASPAFAASPAKSLTVADVQALSTQPSAILQPVKAMATMGLQPAPMPNPDVDPPHSGGPSEPTLAPALMSEKLEFQGNGFSQASNRDYGVDQRTKPAAGLSLSVPVK